MKLDALAKAITLATVTDSPVWVQAIVLGVVGAGMTLLVYGAVAIIVITPRRRIKRCSVGASSTTAPNRGQAGPCLGFFPCNRRA